MKNVTVTETFDLAPEELYKAWTTKETMKKFFDAGAHDLKSVKLTELQVDLKVGGLFSFMMGGGTNLHHGEYKELTPYSKIVFTWSSPVVEDTLVTITFKPKGKKTECVLTHELLPQKWIAAHTEGWMQIFEHLKSIN